MTAHTISSGVISGFDLMSGDALRVLSGGESDGSVVSACAREYVSAGGMSDDDEVLAGGLLVVSAGGLAQDLSVASGGLVSGAGTLQGYNTDYGLITGLTVDNYGYVEDYGETSALTLANGGADYVYAGASAVGDHVSSGGFEYVEQGGTASRTIVYDGGVEVLSSGAVAVGVVVSSGGVVSMTAVFSSGVFRDPASGGTATLSGVAVRGGGGARISSGGIIDYGDYTSPKVACCR